MEPFSSQTEQGNHAGLATYPRAALTSEQPVPGAGPGGPEQTDFLREIVQHDLASGRIASVVTRFPPEPNGYLHIGHAKSICLNFGIAREFGGLCNLRMDDTNPTKEDVEYVDSIIADVKWLIAGWADHCLGLKPKGATAETRDGRRARRTSTCRRSCPPTAAGRTLEPFYASDYFEQLYDYAVELIRKGKAYVCDLTAEEADAMRGAPDRPGKESPFRNRSVEENLDLFARMKAGEFPDGARTLRAKIDMASPNIWLRDPVLYRIRHAAHHHTGDAVVHLPDVRLRALPERLHRGHHALHLHARVRGAPPALRLDSRGPRPAARRSRTSTSSPGSTSPTPS